jgi:dynein heavy chain
MNCSDQMNYKTMANIFAGLSQTGAWGCFDEFNRIPVEVLSVVSAQIKTIQAALGDGLKRFTFEGREIALVSTVGIYITMNPGYAGRTELPENLKALVTPSRAHAHPYTHTRTRTHTHAHTRSFQ